MRILVTADLHYDIARSRKPAQELAERVCDMHADAMVLVGDTAGADLAQLTECLRLFGGFGGKKLMVAGNHCLWVQPSDNDPALPDNKPVDERRTTCLGPSMRRYMELLPRAAAEAGFGLLDHQPAIIRDQAGQTMGLVGSVGWYDYSFRLDGLGVPEDFYRAKVAPGAANYMQEHRHLVEANRHALTEQHLEMGSRWMDGVRVRLGISDEDFVELLARKLERQLGQIAPQVDQVAAFIHHLPFKEMIPPDWPKRAAFAAAYMGSQAIGSVLLACPKITHVYCGHSHWSDTRTIGHLKVINVGSTYVQKNLAVLEA